VLAKDAICPHLSIKCHGRRVLVGGGDRQLEGGRIGGGGGGLCVGFNIVGLEVEQEGAARIHIGNWA